MSKALYGPTAGLPVIMIGVMMMMMSLGVSAQPTVADDDEAYCQSGTFEGFVSQFGADIKTSARDVQQIKEQLSEVKNLLESRQQPCQCSDSDTSTLSVNCIPLLVQQNINGSNSINRSWAEYKVGFNDTRGNFWLGNDLLHQLTASGRYKLRFDLQATNGNWYYAEYSSFIVTSEASNYLMHVSGYSGNAGNADGYGFLYHAGMRFTTYDRDNDLDSSVNCAAVWGGGFWYTECSWANVNSGRGRGNYFAWHSEIGRRIDLQTSRMWLTC